MSCTRRAIFFSARDRDRDNATLTDVAREETTINPPGGLRIVIIDDNEDVAESLKELLEDTGHRVWSAHTGLDGVSLVEEVRPDVVLCDLGLPHIGGNRDLPPDSRVPIAVRPLMVAITGWGGEEDHRQTREAGFDHHLVKPLGADSLDRVLRTVTV